MKRHFFLLFYAVVTANLAFAQSSASVSPDMARHEINAGKVKRIINFYSQGTSDTISFDKNGNQTYPSECLIRRDKNKRLVKITYNNDYNNEEDNYEYKVSYAGSLNRVEYLEEMDIDGYDYRHYYYADNHNAPNGMYKVCCQDVNPSYTEYKYLNFDKYGNWTKREEVIYTDMDVYTGSYSKRFMNLMQRYEKNLNYRKNPLEKDVINLLKLGDKKPDKYIITRQIEYYKQHIIVFVANFYHTTESLISAFRGVLF